MNNPIVTPFIYCGGFQTPIKGQVPNPQNVMNVLTPAFIPGTFSFGIMLGLLDVDFSVPNNVQYVFIDPNGKIVLDTQEINLPSGERNPSLDDDMQGLFINFDFRNVILQVEGTYVSKVIFNKRIIGEYPIKAKAVGINGNM